MMQKTKNLATIEKKIDDTGNATANRFTKRNTI